MVGYSGLPMDRAQLNDWLARGSLGSSWKPRITEKQLDAISATVGRSTIGIDGTRLRSYVESGDRESLSAEEWEELRALTDQAKAAALTPDDAKRIWPRKVAVVVLAPRG